MSFTKAQVEALSQDVKSKLLSGDEGLQKQAMVGTNEYLKLEIRENGLRRKLMPLEQVSDDRLESAGDTDWPRVKIPVAPSSDGAVLVPFETNPKAGVLHTREVQVEFNRIMTPRYGIDKIRMKTWKIPVLDIFQDLMLKDIMDCEDAYFQGMERQVVGEENTIDRDLGVCRNITVGSLSGDNARQALITAGNAMPVLKTNLQTSTIVMHTLTFNQLGVLTRDIVGGDLAQQTFINGTGELKTLFGYKIVHTSKKDIIQPGEAFIYTDPEYYGCFLGLEDISMVTEEKDNIWLRFFMHETVGGAILNRAAVARVRFGETPKDWYNQPIGG